MKKHFSLVAILCMALVSFSACKAHKEYERELEDLYSQIDSLKQLPGAVDTLYNSDTIYVTPQEGELKEYAIVDGAVLAPFSVAEGKQVYFSMGNLQYNAAQNIWRFAEHQYDTIGAENMSIAADYDGWISQFTYGTSGWNGSGAASYQPYSLSTDNTTFLYEDLTGDYARADWGVYNAISNGGNKVGLWRTPSADEWRYIIDTRNNAANLKTFATVNGVRGLILLPDNFNASALGLQLAITTYDFDVNLYTEGQWKFLQKYGAIFLPCEGCCISNTKPYYLGHYGGYTGWYWSSSKYTNTNNYAYNFVFRGPTTKFGDSGNVSLTAQALIHRFCVRLVQDVE